MRTRIFPTVFFFLLLFSSTSWLNAQELIGFGDSELEGRDTAMWKTLQQYAPVQLTGFDLTFKSVRFIKNNFTSIIEGRGELAGIGEVRYRATYYATDTLSSFQVIFPMEEKVRPESLKTPGESENKWTSFYLPPFLRERMVMDSLDFRFPITGLNSSESYYLGCRMLEDWQPFDGVDIKLKKIALGFFTGPVSKTETEKHYDIQGFLSAFFELKGKTEISVTSNLTKNIYDWVISVDARDISINDLVSVFKIEDIGGLSIPPGILNQKLEQGMIDIRPVKGVEIMARTTLGNVNIVVERTTADKKPVSTIDTKSKNYDSKENNKTGFQKDQQQNGGPSKDPINGGFITKPGDDKDWKYSAIYDGQSGKLINPETKGSNQTVSSNLDPKPVTGIKTGNQTQNDERDSKPGKDIKQVSRTQTNITDSKPGTDLKTGNQTQISTTDIKPVVNTKGGSETQNPSGTNGQKVPTLPGAGSDKNSGTEKENKITPATEEKGSKWGFMIGFSLPENFSFKTAVPELGILDKFQLTNAALYISSFAAAPQNSLPVHRNLGFGNPVLPKGINFLFGYDLEKIKLSKKLGSLGDLTGVNLICFSANFPTNISDISLTGGITFNKNVNIAGRIYFPYLELKLKPFAVNPELSLLMYTDLKLNKKETLNFRALGALEANGTIKIAGAMVNDWEEPFGFKGFKIGGLMYQTGIDFSTTPIPTPGDFMITGHASLGDVSGKVILGVDFNEINKNLLLIDVEKLSWNNIINTLCGSNIKNKIPSFAKPVFKSELRKARFKFVPPGASTYTLSNETFTSGYGVGAEGNISGWNGKFDISLEGFDNGLSAGLKASGEMDNINISANGFDIFKFSGSEGKGKPKLVVNLTSEKMLKIVTGKASSADTLVYANASVTILGINNANAFIFLNPEGYTCNLSGKVFGVLDADLQAKISDFSNPLENTYVSVEAKPAGLMKDAQRYLSKAVFDLKLSIDRVYFKGKLDGMKTGVKATVDFTIAGKKKSATVSIKVGSTLDLAKLIFDQIEDIGKIVAKEIEEAFKKAYVVLRDAGKKFINMTAENVPKAFNKAWDKIEEITDKVFDDDEAKRIRITDSTYNIYTYYGDNLLESEPTDDKNRSVFVNSMAEKTLFQEWQFSPTEKKYPEYVYIVNAYNGLNIQVRGAHTEEGAQVALKKHKKEQRGDERIKLLPVPNENGWYYFQVQFTNKYIAVDRTPIAPLTAIQPNKPYVFIIRQSNWTMATHKDNARQDYIDENPHQWTFEPVPNEPGNYYIKHNGDGLYMTLSTRESDFILVQGMQKIPAQKFRVQAVAGQPGYFNIISILNNEVIDIRNGAVIGEPAQTKPVNANSESQQIYIMEHAARARLIQTSVLSDAAKFRIARTGRIRTF